MTALPPLTPIANGTPNDAVPVDTNFDLIADHISGELINRDGSLAMTSELTLSSSTPSAALVAASKAYVDNVTIYTANIAAGNVTEGKIADDAVTEAKIANDAVTNSKIANNAVTASQINAGAVLEGKLADDAVTTVKIADGAVTEAKVAVSAWTTLGLFKYKKVGNIVHVQGRSDPTTALPVGFRPAATVHVPGIEPTAVTLGNVFITTGGFVNHNAPGGWHFSVVYPAA